MGNYRSKLDIIADILQVASRNAKKTQIMYQANLSYKVLQKYLAETVEASLINFEDSLQCYVLTSKGQEFLTTYKKYSSKHKGIEKRLSDINSRKRALESLCSNE